MFTVVYAEGDHICVYIYMYVYLCMYIYIYTNDVFQARSQMDMDASTFT